VFLVLGSPGGRTIINTVLQVILNVVDFGRNVQEAVDAPRFHHQWLPDLIRYERFGLSPDTRALLEAKGHALREVAAQGVVQAILYDPAADLLEGGTDRRAPDGSVEVSERAESGKRPSGADGSVEVSERAESGKRPSGADGSVELP
jgi:gamma-glutamyltranspeptidase/glutathione hydrolase